MLKTMVSFYHFHWLSKILTKLSNPIAHLIVSSFKITKEKKLDYQFHWPLHFFFTPTHNPIQHPMYIIILSFQFQWELNYF
jgi:hypothetical protein